MTVATKKTRKFQPRNLAELAHEKATGERTHQPTHSQSAAERRVAAKKGAGKRGTIKYVQLAAANLNAHFRGEEED